MPLYRRKESPVKAEQYFDPNDNQFTKLIEGVQEADQSVWILLYFQMSDSEREEVWGNSIKFVLTKRGPKRVKNGDWVIHEDTGIEVMSDEKFREYFEAIEEENTNE